MTPAKLNEAKGNLLDFISHGIWQHDTEDTPLALRIFKGIFRWGYLVVYGFFKDQCVIRAAALTFTTILSIVPVLAVAFSISKGFGLQNSDFLRNMLLRMSTGNTEVVDKIILYIDRTNVQTLGWVGVAALLLTVLSLVGTIEKAFNTIWHVERGRTTWRKVGDFLPVLIFCPILILAASSANVGLGVTQEGIVKDILSMSAIGYIWSLLLQLAPLFFLTIAFSFMYAFVPFTRVNLSSALVGGVIGGFLWSSAQWAYINWQIGAAKYNAIYGSFAQVPLLLMWIYISWVIVLLGAEMCYAWQNVNSFVKQRYFGQASALEREKIAVLMMVFLAKRFHNGEPLPTSEEISNRIMAPKPLITDLFHILTEKGFTIEAATDGCETYAPAKALVDTRVVDVIGAVNSAGGGKSSEVFEEEFSFVDEMFVNLSSQLQESDHNRTLLDCAKELADHHEEKGCKPGKLVLHNLV